MRRGVRISWLALTVVPGFRAVQPHKPRGLPFDQGDERVTLVWGSVLRSMHEVAMSVPL